MVAPTMEGGSLEMEPLEALRKAGRIASQVRGRVHGLVEVGTRLIDICESVETWIRDLGGEPAFPCNVDIDHVAAHYTSPPGDASAILDGSLVKVDIGVHVDGYIADTATTVCFDPLLEGLVEAAEAALEAGLKTIRAGARSSDVGAAIEREMKMRGVAPVRNLSGHKVARYIIHAGTDIPNVAARRGHRLEAGETYAIEPFSTLPGAAGEVRDGPPGHIYRFQKKRRVSGGAAKRMLKFIQSRYRTLPFASRWVIGRFPGPEGRAAFQELVRSRCVYAYPQLVERSGGPVAQAEHTVIVTEDGCEVTTA
ncbi:MAG: type II methionyl aminopeptidase [Candidatus Bathyarchaeia archaeon]